MMYFQALTGGSGQFGCPSGAEFSHVALRRIEPETSFPCSEGHVLRSGRRLSFFRAAFPPITI
jgi:hypothetical protein